MVRLCFSGALLTLALSAVQAQSWMGYGGNAQHTAIYVGASQPVSKIHWKTLLDDQRSYYGNVIFAHYASPMVSPLNTVVYGFRSTTTVDGSPDYDNWSMIGVSATSKAVTFNFLSDYSAPFVYPSGWTSVLPMCLVRLPVPQPTRGVNSPATKLTAYTTGGAIAGAAGSICVRASVDQKVATLHQFVFYTTLGDFAANKSSYAPVKVNTPLTSDTSGNIYFGYAVTGTVPASLSRLGSGGVVKLNVPTGVATFKTVDQLGVDSSVTNPAMNAAPVLSNDGSSIYVGLTGSNGGFLAKLSTSTLATQTSTALIDPSVNAAAFLPDVSSASPMVGPDGHVFMGVYRNQGGESHGFMLQFDQNLNPNDATGKKFPTGAFGWDDTPSVVPANLVPSYKGKASYLILCKYNNYDDDATDPDADGSNHVAVLDPTSDSTTVDRQTLIPVMNEVLLILGPTKIGNDPSHPNAVNEWCINSAAVDVNSKSAIINSEDGHVYRWSFVTNTITEGLLLAPATSEAYTSTVIGPDGTIFAINDSYLFAIGN